MRFHSPFWVFLGEFLHVDLAVVLRTAGQTAADRETADRLLTFAADYLAHLQRHGNVMHGLHWTKARVAALRGDAATAIAELQTAARLGSRRGWRLMLDAEFRSLRSDPAFAHLARQMTIG